MLMDNTDLQSKDSKYCLPPINYKYNFKLSMDDVENYAKDMSKHETVESGTLPDRSGSSQSYHYIKMTDCISTKGYVLEEDRS